jgi:hypothetical protein
METIEIQTENAELVKIISESGIEPSKSEEIKQSYLPYFIQIAEVKEQALKINRENPTELDEKIARELRLRMVKIRTGSEAIKEQRKKVHLLAGNLEQSAWNLIKSGCQLEEELFLQVEKRREIAENARKEALKIERAEALIPYEVDPTHLALGEMSEEVWNNFFSGTKIGYENRKEAERLAEEKRIADAKAEAERIEAQRIENEKLKAEAEAKERELEAQRKAAETEKLKAQAILDAERKKADELLETQRKQAEAEKKKQADILAKQKAENEKLQAEIKAKQVEVDRIAKEAEDKRIAEEKARIAAEKKAAKAPDKVKIKSIITDLELYKSPELKAEESQAVYNVITAKFEAFKKWALEQVETL